MGRLTGALALRCVSEMGRALARELPFAATRVETRRLASEAREATELLSAGDKKR